MSQSDPNSSRSRPPAQRKPRWFSRFRRSDGPGKRAHTDPVVTFETIEFGSPRGSDDADLPKRRPRNSEPPLSTSPARPQPSSPDNGRAEAQNDLYTAHFGLTERPFSLLPDPEFIYWAAAHTKAYSMLEYGIMTRAPITLITGEVGAGKTTLLQKLLADLGDQLTVGLVSNAHGDRGELLRWVLMALNQRPNPRANYVDLFAEFQQFLISEYARGQRVVLIFDEAQNMSRESLEELRMFTNINSNKDELLQLVLIGQPELRDMIRRPDMKQFAQRVAASFHLTHMNPETVKEYIDHRLQVAGAEAEIFDDGAAALIHEVTGGIPRLVNQLCDLAMVYAYTEGAEFITRETISSVLADGVFFGFSGEDKGTDIEL